MQKNKYSMELAGRTLTVETGHVAELAGGAAIVRYGDTTVHVTATASDKPRDGIPFFPLNVEYQEKMYAIGKMPGGFIKREGRPSEAAILASRLIDRPLRPLFSKDVRNDVSIVPMVLSVEQSCSPEITAMIASSVALSISNIPFDGPVGSTMVGYIDGEFIINPTNEQSENSDLELTVSSVEDKVIMIEAGGNEFDENLMVEAIEKAHEVNKKIIEFIKKIEKAENPKKIELAKDSIPEEVLEKVADFIGEERMKEAVLAEKVETRREHMEKLDKEVEDFLKELNEEYVKYARKAIENYEKKVVRNLILKEEKRIDGRSLNELRELTAKVDFIPRVHGSGMFKRGQTQVLNIITLASMADTQSIDGLDKTITEKRYIHHYNFPSFSVGETRPSRGPGRREIGHGALAEKALKPVIPSSEEFPYAIRAVSEVLSSNGSTSQASVCASSLALMAAGVPIKTAVAGISVGLITGESDDEYKLITDIQGLEDHLGDMDFKVAGTKDGITAIQLDMKVKGITLDVVKKSIMQATEARYKILDDVMNKEIDKPREELACTAPIIQTIKIDPAKIKDVIGKGGKTIDSIIEKTGVKIDIEDDGEVYIAGDSAEEAQEAIKIIKAITTDPEVGQICDAKIVKIMSFGAFVEYAPSKEGLVHISKFSHERIDKVEDLFSEGDEIRVKIIKVDKDGKVSLSRKALLPKPEKKENKDKK